MKMKWANVAKSSATKCKAQRCEADLQYSILVNYLIINELKRSFRNLKFRPPITAYSPRMKGRDLKSVGIEKRLKNELECICQITQTFWHHLTENDPRNVYLLIVATPELAHGCLLINLSALLQENELGTQRDFTQIYWFLPLYD